MTAREAILAKVRSSLGATAGDAKRQAAADQRITATQRHLTPERVAGKTQSELASLLRQHLAELDATLIEADTEADVPSAISEYLRKNNLPQRIRHGSDPRLIAMDWSAAPSLDVATGHADPADEVGVSHAIAAVAETGTLVVTSGPDNPVTLNFLPETHVIVMRESDLVGPYEDAFARVRQRFGNGAMPRTINMLTGPSRTGDIGGRIVLGAHGPRRMAVVIVKDSRLKDTRETS